MTARLTWRGHEFNTRLKVAVADGLYAAALVGADAAVRVFGTEGNPSRPGGYPGIRTGHLRNSIHAVHPRAVSQRRGGRISAKYGTRVRYGRYLEYGTRRMLARPWLSRTGQKAVPRMRRQFLAVVRRRLGVR